jgi:hypothetical protein
MEPRHRWIPTEIQQIILDWMLELHRADAIQAYEAAWSDSIRRTAVTMICEDIRSNPPTYQFDVLTQRRSHLRLAIVLPDCNPVSVQLGNRIPEASLIAFRRRARACCPAAAAEIRVITTQGGFPDPE